MAHGEHDSPERFQSLSHSNKAVPKYSSKTAERVPLLAVAALAFASDGGSFSQVFDNHEMNRSPSIYTIS